MTGNWRFVSRRALELLHDESLAEHGGRPGLRDEGLLESALARPRQLLNYGEPDLAALAASYAFGLARKHVFVDGNKRVAFLAENPGKWAISCQVLGGAGAEFVTWFEVV